MDLSVMFFGADDSSDHAATYADILAIARAADELGFTAIWTPERHFQPVGQVFPNPALLAAALATVTSRIALRAGSVVLPLHHPLQVVEDWAVVDNLSGGRVGISAATGWHSADFALAPDRFADRRRHTQEAVDTVRRLWAGQDAEFTDGLGTPVRLRPQPRPSSPALPIWLTSSGSPRSWADAARLRTHVLAATMGLDRDTLSQRIADYRTGYAAAPAQVGAAARGTVTVMTHCYVAESDARARADVLEPLTEYFRAHVRQTAADRSGTTGQAMAALSPEEVDLMAGFAVRRNLGWGSLIGSPASCRATLADFEAIGCDEIACFVDFGPGRDAVLDSLRMLAELRQEVAA